MINNYLHNYKVLIAQGSILDSSNMGYSNVMSIIDKFSQDKYLKQISVVLKKKDGNNYYFYDGESNRRFPLVIGWKPSTINIDKDRILTSDMKNISTYLNKNTTYKSYVGYNINRCWTLLCLEEV